MIIAIFLKRLGKDFGCNILRIRHVANNKLEGRDYSSDNNRENHEGVLVDSHWIGGDPSKGEIYGFASWNPNDGTLMLRNPSSKPVDFSFSLSELLELPKKFEGKYSLFNVRTESEEGTFNSSKKGKIHLSAFEVKVMNVKANF